MLGIGIAVGITLSILLDRVLYAWAGGSSRDPITLLASAALLVLVAAVACIVPSWRAATIDPMRALRIE
jgi:ABC-type antimicrobial peptide transport system permease subunit